MSVVSLLRQRAAGNAAVRRRPTFSAHGSVVLHAAFWHSPVVSALLRRCWVSVSNSYASMLCLGGPLPVGFLCLFQLSALCPFQEVALSDESVDQICRMLQVVLYLTHKTTVEREETCSQTLGSERG